ncbi:hypothetical protein K431DRAFT_287032 [Polychaeton citri CBS 116435]|uniref:Nascent polypeptide-associated complex subunit alpha-like UBA domain-containing protein n=1 Tax=Polychaeton citri CBS 116435 TaxID=1314669 RepID=A0A9P4Q412_9PEZI|nr:hypothetical protein K431DRAFT_287032 [Polychaeton citri CBS 116435]
MAEEPQPSNFKEGKDAPDVIPANAEDRKAAAAMSSLDVHGEDDESKPKKDVDMKALSDAINNLEKKPGQATGSANASGAKKEEPKKPIKVDAGDVNMLADQLDLSKTKATDLLRAHDADAVKAMTAWVQAF